MKLFSDKIINIKSYIAKNDMVKKDDGVVVGLSGGPDSVCLLFVLLSLKEELGLTLRAVHYNHGIRGESADRDEHFVVSLCRRVGVELVCERGDIPALSKESGRSVEEEGRLRRYECFEKARQELIGNGIREVKIAIAHNADDNAETVIFHMARGCGLSGACGIAPVRGAIIRPLLRTSKADILAMLEDISEGYCVDETNLDVDYDRNRIRHNIMPQLYELNCQYLSHMASMTEHLREAADYINDKAGKLIRDAEEGDGYSRSVIRDAEPLVRKYALKSILSSYMPMKKDVSESHIEMVIGAIMSTETKVVHLPHGKEVICSGEKMWIREVDGVEGEKLPGPSYLKLESLEEGQWGCAKYEDVTVKYRVFSIEKDCPIQMQTYTKWLDYDKIKGDVALRLRRETDYITVTNDGHTKKLKEYFINEKIPKEERDKKMIVCDGHEVIWVPGYRIGTTYKITENTRRILEITIDGGESNE